MVNIFQVLLLITVALYPSMGMPCNTECGSPCYRERCQSSSCGTSDGCCGSSCHSTVCSSYRSCDVQCCQNSNCCQKNCCNCCSPTSTVSTTRVPIMPPPERQVVDDSGETKTSSLSNSNSSITLPVNISVTNDIPIRSIVSVPVSVTVYNENKIHITNQEDFSDGRSNTSTDVAINKTIVNQTEIVKIPVPYIHTIPITQSVDRGCCHMVQPCDPYRYPGCTVSNSHCSSSCQGDYMYNPINVCQQGCYQNQYATGLQCKNSGCHYQNMNCLWCGQNFYQSYENFMMCSGCFVPSNWG